MFQSKPTLIILVIVVIVLLLGVGYIVFIKSPSNNQPVACTMEAKLCPDGSSVGRFGPKCEFAACPSEVLSGYTKFGNDVNGDFNNDGLTDTAYLVTKQPGGSGTFYYLAVVLKNQSGDQTLVSEVIGDRIAPQTTEFKDSMIIVNYADRKADEPFSVQPSVGLSKYYKIIDGQLRAVVPPLSNVNQGSDWSQTWATYYLAGQNIQFKYPKDLQVEYITPQDWPPQITIKTGQFICNAQDGSASLPTRTLKKIYNNNTYCIEAMSEGAAGSVYTTYIYTTQKDAKLISAKFTLRFPQCLNYDDPKKTACQNERTTFDLDSLVDQIINSIKPAVEPISDLLKVSSPAVNAVVSSPLKIVGQARGTYFFEASFPIELKDQDGNIMAQTTAQAKSDWMTENFVPFEAKLTFDKPNTKVGRLILKKDNPSGLSQNDVALEIPIKF